MKNVFVLLYLFGALALNLVVEARSFEPVPRVSKRHENNQLDEAVRAVKETNLEDVTKALAHLTHTDRDKAWAVYIWLTENIAYDTEAYFTQSKAKEIFDPQVAFKKHHAICYGYTALYKLIGEKFGLKIEIVEGNAKGFAYKGLRELDEHAWNAVLLDGKWMLIDPTWGAGYVGDDKTFKKEFNDYFFDIHPKLLKLTHYPKNMQWFMDEVIPEQQAFMRTSFFHPKYLEALIKNGMSEEEAWQVATSGTSINGFTLAELLKSGIHPKHVVEIAQHNTEVDAFVVEKMLAMGFQEAQIAQQLIAAQTFPIIYETPESIKVVDAPANGVLSQLEPQHFRIEAGNYREMFLQNGSQRTALQKAQRSFGFDGKLQPGQHTLFIGPRPDGQYTGIMAYEVK